MVTFASEVKKELTLLEVHREHAKAELAALIRMNGAVSLYQQRLILNVQSENAAIARRLYKLLKDFYQIEGELIVRRKMKLKKNNVYIVRCHDNINGMLNEMHILDGLMFVSNISDDIVSDIQKKRSYLRGAFLAGGSVNNPDSSNYHLEIYSSYEEHNKDLCDLMNDFDLNAKIVARRNGYITYLKESEKISEFLALIGANQAMMKFEDVRIVRDLRNSINRLVNCENANMNKVADAAQRQVEAIRIIDQHQGLHNLPEKLQVMAEFRVNHPEMSLKELGEKIPGGPISKSGVNHRLRRIVKIAEEIQ